MKIRIPIIAFSAFLAGAVCAAVYPAIAQQTGAQSAWKVDFTRPTRDSGTVTFVKHNRVTGQTLILTCVRNECGDEEIWRQFPEEDGSER